MHVVAVLNRKGGVGKTSLVFHLGGELAQDGRRVLLVDMDPQASLTQAFYGPAVLEKLPAERSVAALFGDGFGITPGSLVSETPIKGLHLLPGSESLSHFNLPDPDSASQLILRDAIHELSYDWVLIDCPPNLALCSQAALVAAAYVLVPLAPEDFACQGVPAVQLAIAAAHSWLTGCVLNLVDSRLALHAAYIQMLRRVHADNLFDAVLPLAVAFKDAISARQPVAQHNPRSAAAKAVAAVALELERRVSRKRKARSHG